MYVVLHVDYPLLLSDFNETWIFSTDFRKMRRFYGNLSDGSRVFHAGGQTDMTKLIVVYRNYANAPKKHTLCVSVLMFSGVQGPCCALAYIVRLWVWYIWVRTVHRVLTVSPQQETVYDHSCLLSDFAYITFFLYHMSMTNTRRNLFPIEYQWVFHWYSVWFEHILFMLSMNTGLYPCVGVQS